MALPRFTGFPQEAIAFFDKLEANNNRTWFQAHKDVYERACRQPMVALLAELEPKYGAGKIFRINRDTRFSADKRPYKTNIAASFGRNYVSLGGDGLYVAAGVYMLEGAALTTYRDAVADDASGAELEQIAAKLDRKKYQFGSHDILQTAPKGYPRDHRRIRFLRYKGLYAGTGWPPGPWLSTRRALERISRVLDDVAPLNAWFDRYVPTR